MLASDMDIQLGLGTTSGPDGIVEWVYPTPYPSAPMVVGTPRDNVVAGVHVVNNDNVGGLVVIQLATHEMVRAQVFTVTAGAVPGLGGTVRAAKAGVDVNFVAFWPII